MIQDPDYARIFTQARICAWQYGFACLVHGSYTRDLDILLVPWTDEAKNSDGLRIVRLIADACDLRIVNNADNSPNATHKPHGRVAYTLLFPGAKDRRWVDVSIMPTIEKQI